MTFKKRTFNVRLTQTKANSLDQAFIVCQPAYAYGPLGVPPCIPPKSTIIFQVRVEGVADDFMKTFLRMDCHERRVIPLKFVLDQAEDHCMVIRL